MRRSFGHGGLWSGACPCCGPEALVPEHAVPRRGLLAAVLAGAGAVAAGPVLAQGATRSLRVRRQVTNDSFSGVYFRDGRYDREALRRLDFVFRDLSRAETTPMDPRLFDVMSTVARQMDSDESFEVVSGYRTPETNAGNARRSTRVSRVSLHMSGMAADCRLPGRNSMQLARLAADMRLGGVGLYQRDGFVHLDCGPVRRW
ncbi:DUF882 domain-containing protein [Roseomonas frigidaquae]|uniref:Murein endopeptidase K n=1 Tax=Falsiroseomonas frigidaquae TaxID=487318 RepID=A0ABX1F8Y9_9PROT|nr:DUF882 domain-containing protein [Falsiroseomonas frigidaquae]NKE48694.1 DUF882 domain-containing protein [Falsiroseomonas frigidaquae]